MTERVFLNQEFAKQSHAWQNNVLEVSRGLLGSMKSTQGEVLQDSDLPSVTNWVMTVTEDAMKEGQSNQANRIINLNVLQGLPGNHKEIMERIKRLSESVRLPQGPTHGDLHRNNIVKLKSQFFAIDLDRFDLNSCPLFDRLHFYLYEAKLNTDKGTARRWASLLVERKDLVAHAARDRVSPEELMFAYALQRSLLEMSVQNQLYGGVIDLEKRIGILKSYCDVFENG